MKTDFNKLAEKAKAAVSPEELLETAHEEEYPLTEEGAEKLFNDLHASGVVSDDELADVSGGGCSHGGHTVVSSGLKCFTDCFESNFTDSYHNDRSHMVRTDHEELRKLWRDFCINSDPDAATPGECPQCGMCRHLAFDGGIGYCEKSKS